ncbi:unnamed protein product, partial [Polarella glacialis]
MVAASCLTQAGELHLTAVGATPFVSRSTIDSFADAIIRTLTIATEMRLPKRGLSVPRVDYPVNIRGSMPSFYPLETPKGALQCPAYEDVKSSRMPSFDADKYVGIWYELAFHDITQFNGCGCTQFNMTRRDLVIEDMFTVNCPWPWRSGVEGPWLPGFSKISGQRKLNLYTCNMTMYINPQRPGVMMETGFGQEFDNMVLEIWQDPEIQAETGYEFTRAIQFQCLGSPVDGQITFTGINFLSRVPIISPGMLQEMFVRARALGLEPFGANDMHKVEHEGCYYPKSTDRSWMGERPEWPSPVLDQELGAERDGWERCSETEGVAEVGKPTEEEPMCRICLCLDGSRADGDNFLTPCRCSGTQRLVHEKCLREWQWTVIGGPNESRALRCSVCDSSFKCGFLGLPEKTPVSEGLWVRSAACFVLVVLAALVLLRICDDSDSGHLQAKELREGMLLVATDRIGTGFFFQSVVLLVEHSTLGAK